MSVSQQHDLEARLCRPDRGENGYVDGREQLTRIEAVRRLVDLARNGEVERSTRHGGINTHVHTAKSFAFFASPAEAAWHAYRAAVSVFGINDHYTLAGHDEFRAACTVLGIHPMFSMEAVAFWEAAGVEGATVNDPANPGRTYLTAKGVTRPFPSQCQGETDLRRMNAALESRNQEMTRKVAEIFTQRLGLDRSISWASVQQRTPHDQPTERHIAQVTAEFLEDRFPDVDTLRRAASKLLDAEISREVLEDPASFQNTVRARLLKAGCPAYVAESTDAFIPVERMVSLALDLGAIPTYPVLGNPVTPWERDIEQLLDRLEELRIFAVEVIPDRNTPERLREVVAAAAARDFPVVGGTEHNTKSAAPLVDKFFFDPEFRPHFELGARVVLGHQELRRVSKPGYVDEHGALPAGDRRANLERVAAASPYPGS